MKKIMIDDVCKKINESKSFSLGFYNSSVEDFCDLVSLSKKNSFDAHLTHRINCVKMKNRAIYLYDDRDFECIGLDTMDGCYERSIFDSYSLLFIHFHDDYHEHRILVFCVERSDDNNNASETAKVVTEAVKTAVESVSVKDDKSVEEITETQAEHAEETMERKKRGRPKKTEENVNDEDLPE